VATIQKPNNLPLDPRGILGVPAHMVPSFRTCKAAENNAQMNVLIKAHGGVGDVVCSEPAMRFAVENFKNSNFSLLSPYPQLFRHIPWKKVYDNSGPVEIDLNQYLMFQTIDVTNELAAEFVCHAIMGGVDYAGLNMWRLILPNAYKRIQLYPNEQETQRAVEIHQDRDIVVHPGRTWPSRTFPKKWWDRVIGRIIEKGGRPLVIGGVIDAGRASTVEVDLPTGVLDLRHKQTLMETVALMHKTVAVITNDSSPVHMASTGPSWIAYLSTVKHPDHLTHWRRTDKGVDEYGWRMKDFALGGLYKELDFCPNSPKNIHVDKVDILQLLKWLPEPEEIADWVVSKL